MCGEARKGAGQALYTHGAMATTEISPSTVAQRLASQGSARLGALQQLRQKLEHDPELAFAAAPLLVDLMTRSAAEVPHNEFQQAGLALMRLLATVPPDGLPALYGAAMGGGKMTAMLSSKTSVVGQAAAKPADELARDDAWSYACMLAHNPTIYARGWSAPWIAAGFQNPLDYAAALGLNVFSR